MASVKFEHELNNIRVLASSEKLSRLERGELYIEFCQRHKITFKELTRLLTGKQQIGKDQKEYKELHRNVSIYKRYTKASDEDKKKIKDLSDRNKWVALRIREPNKEKKIDFLLRNIKGLPSADIESLVAVMNGDKPITDYETKVRTDYDKRITLIRLLKKEMLGLEQ